MMNIFEIIKAKPVDDYEKRITPLLNNLWNRFSFDAIDKAIEAISKGEPFLQPFTDAANKVAMSVQSAVKAQTKAIWEQKNKIEIIQKANNISFNKPNQSAIDKLVKGQLAWIGEHGSKSKIAQEISDAYGKLWGEGKIRTEIVKALKTEFGKYTPEKYAEKFGEESYWKMFTQHHAVLSSSFASLNRMRKTEKYIFWARQNERTCEQCGFYHNKTFITGNAIESMDNYIKAAGNGDTEAMKSARPFVTDNTATNPIPPLHIGCRCKMMATGEYTINQNIIEDLRKDNIKFSFDAEDVKTYNSSMMKKFDYETVNTSLTDIFGKGTTTVRYLKQWKQFDYEFSNKNIEVQRRFDALNNVVYHDYFKITDSMQGKGLSKNVLKSFYLQYKIMGVKKIFTDPGLDNGGYTWAKYGFAAKRIDVKDLLIKAVNKDVYNCLENILKLDGEYLSLRNLADLTDKDGNKIGKDFLTGKSWHGVLDFKNKEQMKIWENYLYGKE